MELADLLLWAYFTGIVPAWIAAVWLLIRHDVVEMNDPLDGIAAGVLGLCWAMLWPFSLPGWAISAQIHKRRQW